MSKNATGARRAHRAALRQPPPLETLGRARGAASAFLSEVQRRAGQRLRQDFERAQLRQRLTRDPARPPSDPASCPAAFTPHQAALDARRRCLEALATAGPGLGDLLFETICMEQGLEDSERQFGWPARSAKAILALALDRIAAHYGLVSGGRRPGRLEAWRAADDAA